MTVALADPPRRPVFRVLPAPRTEPPFDDELPEPPSHWSVVDGQVALALDFTPSGAALLQLLTGDDDDAAFAHQRTGRSDLPDPAPWARRFAQAVVEVLSGTRPTGQLVVWTSTYVLEQVELAVTRLGRTGTRNLRAQQRPTVRSVHVCEPDDGVAEVCATVRRGERTTALALRLEGVDGRWQCTALRTH